MMNDTKFAQSEPPAASNAPGPEPRPEHAAPPAGDTTAAPAPGVSPAMERFKSCRWRCEPDAGAFCTHRDVLPFAGKEGFNAESWCPDCGYYKLRRTPKKRERVDYTY
jgi:hypothetical protein